MLWYKVREFFEHFEWTGSCDCEVPVQRREDRQTCVKKKNNVDFCMGHRCFDDTVRRRKGLFA